MHWQTSRRNISLDRPLVMGILNVTPDSFSDGGRFASLDAAVKHAETMIAEGVDIIDVGGESTRPGSRGVPTKEEIDRVVPVIEAISRRAGVPISVDTSKSAIARAALDAGAEIVNDISGLRFDPDIAIAAAENKAGLVLMHSRGDFDAMHTQPPVDDILADVVADFRRSIAFALENGVGEQSIVLDIGIGFGKTVDQNLELIGKLDRLIAAFPQFPMLAGTSRKSFIGKVLNDASPAERLIGSLTTAAIAVWNGAKIVRVHDVRETVETVKLVTALKPEVGKSSIIP